MKQMHDALPARHPAGWMTATLLAALILAVVAGCGGGSSSSPGEGSGSTAWLTPGTEAAAVGDPLPAEATSSVPAMVAWMLGLIGRGDDTSIPYSLGGATLPISDDQPSQPL